MPDEITDQAGADQNFYNKGRKLEILHVLLAQAYCIQQL